MHESSRDVQRQIRRLRIPALGVADELVVELGGGEVAVEGDALVDGVDAKGLVEVARGEAVDVAREVPGARRVRVGEHARGRDDGVLAKDGLDRAANKAKGGRVGGRDGCGLKAVNVLVADDRNGQVLRLALLGLLAKVGDGESELLGNGYDNVLVVLLGLVDRAGESDAVVDDRCG